MKSLYRGFLLLFAFVLLLAGCSDEYMKNFEKKAKDDIEQITDPDQQQEQEAEQKDSL